MERSTTILNNVNFCCQAFFEGVEKSLRITDAAFIFFAKESGGVVSNSGLPEWVSNLLSSTKAKFD
jgi:hypothetical protein